MVKRSGEYTSNIFKSCVREVLGLKDQSEEDLHIAMDLIRHVQLYGTLHTEDEIKDMIEAKTQIDELYQQKITELSTKSLQEILITHDSGELKRTSRTIETIITELARRSIFNDVVQSDLKSNNGDLDVPKEKSRRNSRKTSTKASNTN